MMDQSSGEGGCLDCLIQEIVAESHNLSRICIPDLVDVLVEKSSNEKYKNMMDSILEVVELLKTFKILPIGNHSQIGEDLRFIMQTAFNDPNNLQDTIIQKDEAFLDGMPFGDTEMLGLPNRSDTKALNNTVNITLLAPSEIPDTSSESRSIIHTLPCANSLGEYEVEYEDSFYNFTTDVVNPKANNETQQPPSTSSSIKSNQTKITDHNKEEPSVNAHEEAFKADPMSNGINQSLRNANDLVTNAPEIIAKTARHADPTTTSTNPTTSHSNNGNGISNQVKTESSFGIFNTSNDDLSSTTSDEIIATFVYPSPNSTQKKGTRIEGTIPRSATRAKNFKRIKNSTNSSRKKAARDDSTSLGSATPVYYSNNKTQVNPAGGETRMLGSAAPVYVNISNSIQKNATSDQNTMPLSATSLYSNSRNGPMKNDTSAMLGGASAVNPLSNSTQKNTKIAESTFPGRALPLYNNSINNTQKNGTSDESTILGGASAVNPLSNSTQKNTKSAESTFPGRAPALYNISINNTQKNGTSDESMMLRSATSLYAIPLNNTEGPSIRKHLPFNTNDSYSLQQNESPSPLVSTAHPPTQGQLSHPDTSIGQNMSSNSLNQPNLSTLYSIEPQEQPINIYVNPNSSSFEPNKTQLQASGVYIQRNNFYIHPNASILRSGNISAESNGSPVLTNISNVEHNVPYISIIEPNSTYILADSPTAKNGQSLSKIEQPEQIIVDPAVETYLSAWPSPMMIRSDSSKNKNTTTLPTLNRTTTAGHLTTTSRSTTTQNSSRPLVKESRSSFAERTVTRSPAPATTARRTVVFDPTKFIPVPTHLKGSGDDDGGGGGSKAANASQKSGQLPTALTSKDEEISDSQYDSIYGTDLEDYYNPEEQWDAAESTTTSTPGPPTTTTSSISGDIDENYNDSNPNTYDSNELYALSKYDGYSEYLDDEYGPENEIEAGSEASSNAKKLTTNGKTKSSAHIGPFSQTLNRFRISVVGVR